jgi:hypothetical protein
MKKILLLCVFSLTACGLEYDAETRLVSQTRIVDSQGNPIAAKPVEIWVSDNGITDIISNGVTDADGRILLIFPAPNNIDAPIEIHFPQNNEFVEKTLLNIKRADFTDYKLTLDNLPLYHIDELTTLEVTLNQTSTDMLVDLDLENNPGALSIFWNQPEENNGPQTYHQVAKNTTVDLVYKVRNAAGVESTQTIPVSVGNDAVNYTLTY